MFHRIQQIQLLGRNIKPPNFEKMWHQLEAEIHLHRHKTVIKACRGSKSHSIPKEVRFSIFTSRTSSIFFACRLCQSVCYVWDDCCAAK